MDCADLHVESFSTLSPLMSFFCFPSPSSWKPLSAVTGGDGLWDKSPPSSRWLAPEETTSLWDQHLSLRFRSDRQSDLTSFFNKGRASGVHPANADPNLAVQGEGSTQGQWQLSLQPLPWSHTTQSVPMCLWHHLSHCPSAWAQVNCPWVSLRTGPLEGCLGFQQPPLLPGWMESSLIFTARCCGGSSSWHWVSGLGSSV